MIEPPQDAPPMVSRPTAESPQSAAVPVGAPPAAVTPPPAPAPAQAAPAPAEQPAAAPLKLNYSLTPEARAAAMGAAPPVAPAVTPAVAAPAAAPATAGLNYSLSPEEKAAAQAMRPPVPVPQLNYSLTPEERAAAEGGFPTTVEAKPSFLTSSIFGKGSAEWLGDRLSDTMGLILPKDATGQPGYFGTVAKDLARAPAGIYDFLTSPVGLAVATSHLVPALAPFAAGADIFMGAQAGLSSIGSAANFAQDPGDPHKLAQMMIDIASAYLMAKGGMRYKSALEEVPANVRAGTPLLKATYDALKTPPPPLPEARFTRGKELLQRLQDAEGDTEAQQAIIKEAAQPTSLADRARMKLWTAPETAPNKFLSGVASVGRAGAAMLGVEAPPLYDLGRYLLEERARAIGSQYIDTARFTNQMQKTVPDAAERGIRRMGYVMEDSATPEEAGLTQAGLEGVKKAREFQRGTDELLDEGHSGQMALRDAETYLTHMWDLRTVDTPTRQSIAKTMMRDPYNQGRSIPTYQAGIEDYEEHGLDQPLKPLYDDVATVIAKRRMTAAVTLANQNFANTLRDLGLVMDPAEARKAGLNWSQIEDAPALNRAVYAGKTKTGDIFRYQPPVVNPDIRMAVDAIFQKPWNPPTLAAIENLRAFGKQMNVDFSLFHHLSLAEVGGAQFAPSGFKGLAGGLFTAGNELWKGTRAAVQELRGKAPTDAPPVVDWPEELVDPFAGRLNFNTTEHEQVITDKLRRMEPFVGQYTKLLNPVARGVGMTSYIFNRALFDFYQQGLMLKAANKIHGDWLGSNLGATEEQITNHLDATSDHVNRSFGAQNLETLGLSPNTRRVLGMLMFAPVWTLSGIRNLTAGYETATGANLTNRYLASAAAMYFLTTQALNYMMTGLYGMKDKNGVAGAHFTWDNDGPPLKLGNTYVDNVSQHVFDVGWGYNPDGSQRYFQPGKQLRAGPKWFADPTGTASASANPLLGLTAVAATGSAPGGYKVWEKTDSPEIQNWRTAAKVLDTVTPFSTQWVQQWGLRAMKPTIFPEPTVSTQFMGVPTTKGLTFGNAVDRYREAIEAGRQDVAIKVLQAAANNGLDAKQVALKYWKSVKIGMKTEMGRPWTYDTSGVRTAAPPQR